MLSVGLRPRRSREAFVASRERDSQALDLRRKGMTYREIAEQLNVGRARAHQMVERGQYFEELGSGLSATPGPQAGGIPDHTPWRAMRALLSQRPWAVVWNEGCETVGQARALQDDYLLSLPNFGPNSLRELREVVGQPQNAA
jgi:hypothetical protein